MDLRKGETVICEKQVPSVFYVKLILQCCTVLLIPFALIDLLRVLTSKGVVTSERIFVKWGVINSIEFSGTLDKIASVSTHQGLFGKIFNYGHVVVSNTAGEKYPLFTAAPSQVKSIVFEVQERYKEEQMKKQAVAMAQAMKSA